MKKSFLTSSRLLPSLRRVCSSSQPHWPNPPPHEPPTSQIRPISDETQQVVLLNTLLGQRSDPTCALNLFKQVNRGDVDTDTIAVMVHILMGCPHTHGPARELLNSYVSGNTCPAPPVVMLHSLLDSAKRFGFDSESLGVFSYLLNSYVRAKRMRDAVDCLTRMLDLDILASVKCINGVLTELVRTNMVGDARCVYDQMLRRGVVGDSATLHVMIRACLKQGDPKGAEDYFINGRASGIQADQPLCNVAISAFSKIPHSRQPSLLLGQMRERGWVASEDSFTSLIVACVKRGHMVQALRLKDEMLACRGSINLAVAASLMRGYCAQGNLDSALDLFATIIDDGLVPNRSTYALVIQGCSKIGNMDKAYELYNQMKQNSVEPDIFILKHMLLGFLNNQSPEDASKLFDEALEYGVAHVFLYNNVLSWLCREGKVSEASSLWDKMMSNGVVPNVESYNNRLHGYCTIGDMDRANNVFLEMLERGLKPSVFTFSILMQGYFKKGDAQHAFNVFDDMVAANITPTDFSINIAINGLCKVGRTSEANDLLKKFVDKGFVPKCMTYNSIIDGFMKEGAIDSALIVYREMCEGGVVPTVFTYTSLIHGLCKSNKLDLALNMWNEMKNNGIKLDVTAYCALIDGFCKRRDMKSASKFFAELLEVGLSPNTAVYNSMFSGFRDVNNMEAALGLHKKMIKEGVPCDLKAYTTLIDGLLKDGDLQFASYLYSEMLSKGITPDKNTCSVLLYGFCKKGQLEKARGILEEMNTRGLTASVHIYIALIVGHFKEGNLEESFRLHDEMLDKGLVPDRITWDVLVNGKFKGTSALGSSL